jgi:serine/threonine-protein kinase
MREELRASLLKIYFLKLREVRGEAAARDVFVAAGLDPSWIEQETAWVSVEATRRALVAIGDELGAQSLHEVASFVGHAEALGPWVRMVREAKQPIDAYRYVGAHVQEQTRVGEYEVEEPGVPAKPSMPPPAEPKLDAESTQPAPAIPDKPTAPPRNAPRVRFTYKPRPDEPTETDDLLCTVREQQLSGLTTLWGLPPARVEHEACLAKGGDCCKYALRWDDEPPIAKRAPLLGIVAALVAFVLIVYFHWIAALIAAVIAGALGYGMGTLFARQRRLERDRAFERTRIATLERGLELRGDVATVAPGDLVGTILGGKYRIGKRIGSGGIGVVHAAEHIGLGTQVAIKVLRGAAAKDGSEIARLRREAQVASALDHPNVVKVLDLDQLQDGSIYVVMELLRGRSLAEKLHKEGPIAPAFAVKVFRQVCNALAAAHDLGVVHRDLKPGNVFLCDDGETAKVLDFGMSKLAVGATGNEKLTQDGYTLGTPEYMAPEQCIGAAVEPRTDLYELGVLIYEALTGDLPIKSQNRRELLDLHQRQVPPPMRQKRPDLPIPRELDDAVAMCLRKRANDRPDSARTFERMLGAVPLEGVPMQYPRNMGRKAPQPAQAPQPAVPIPQTIGEALRRSSDDVGRTTEKARSR